MRISDWSSDVCSADLTCFAARRKQPAVQLAPPILGGVGRMNQEPGTAGSDRVADPVGPGDERAAARLKAQPVKHLPLQCIGDPVGQVIRPADIARLESPRERPPDRKAAGSGQRGLVRVYVGGRGTQEKKNNK